LKEVNKVYKIYQGFFGDKLPKEITTERRENATYVHLIVKILKN